MSFTFHNGTRALPVEITLNILEHISADTRLPLMGGGVKRRRSYHPIASVSRALRELYLKQPYSAKKNGKAPALTCCNVGAALYFDDLQTLTCFFREGPNRSDVSLRQIRYIGITYIDSSTDGCGRTTNYAYDALELLYQHWHLMAVSQLQLYVLWPDAVSSVDDPGVWSLLKIRDLKRLDILGPRRCVAPVVRAHLKAQTRRKKCFPWRPLGIENPTPRHWKDKVKYRSDIEAWQAEYEYLDVLYKNKHDRETVLSRCKSQRIKYHKRRRRWPMLGARRRRSSLDVQE